MKFLTVSVIMMLRGRGSEGVTLTIHLCNLGIIAGYR